MDYLYKGKHLHSLHNPYREARHQLQAISYTQQNILIIIGAGFLYELEVMIVERHFSRQGHIYLIYDSAELIKVCLHTRDLRFLEGFAPQNLHVLYPEVLSWEEILDTSYLTSIHFTGTVVVDHRHHYAKPVFLDRCVERLQQALTTWFSTVFTQLYFEKVWLKHSMKHLRYLPRIFSFDALRGQFSGKACALIGAGPSLYAGIDVIKEMRHKWVLIATDTALKVLIKNHCVPDMVVALDSGYYNALDFLVEIPEVDAASLSLGSCCLLTDMAVHPIILRRFEGLRFVYTLEADHRSEFSSSSTALLHALGFQKSLKKPLPVGSSVWNVALHAALEMGFLEFHFLGLDLSYPDLETHCQGTTQSEYRYTRSSRLSPVSSQGAHDIFMRSASLRSAQKTDEDVHALTAFAFDQYRREIHTTLRSYLDKGTHRFINYSPYLGDIAGVERASYRSPTADLSSDVVVKKRPLHPPFRGTFLCSEEDSDRIRQQLKMHIMSLQSTLISILQAEEPSAFTDTDMQALRDDLKRMPFLERGLQFLGMVTASHKDKRAYYSELYKLCHVLKRALQVHSP